MPDENRVVESLFSLGNGHFGGRGNHEEQYSIWPADREVPLGWKAVGKQGTRQECLDYIEEVWTDMRPLSLRRAL